MFYIVSGFINVCANDVETGSERFLCATSVRDKQKFLFIVYVMGRELNYCVFYLIVSLCLLMFNGSAGSQSNSL